MKLLLGSLKPTDTVAIVVYAGAAGQVLPPTPVSEKEKIVAALDSLTPGGSTAGAEGIALAYQLAEKNFRKEGVNRILLCTDGDFNVGIDSTNELKGFVERKREKGVFLSVLGFGQGNYRDELAQALAQNGNGVAAYIDTLNEAQKVLVQEAGSSLFTIAKDVKLQVEFNPASPWPSTASWATRRARSSARTSTTMPWMRVTWARATPSPRSTRSRRWASMRA